MSPSDRGALSLELVALFGALLLLVMLVVQGASWWFDRQVALGAAREGAAVAADTRNGGQNAELVAQNFLNRNSLLMQKAWADKPVPGNIPGTASVTVHAKVRSILGALAPDITVKVTVPIEQFVGAGG